MIGKRGKATLLLYMIFLAVLFLMCSTDLIIREPEKEIYQIAVIIEDSRDDNYGSFRKGMDQAALELNADVRFFTLYEKLDADQQMELIGREQQDGADALIVVPADEDRVVDALAGHQVTVPMVLLGSGLTGEGVTGTVVVDYGKMGELLGQKMAEHMDEHRTVLVFSDPSAQSGASRRFLEGARNVMEEEGILCRLVVRDGEQGFKPFTESLDAEGQVLILAESPEILAETAGILAELPDLSCRVSLYGRGSTLPVLNYLDRGLIRGLCVTDEFSIGYFSVGMAVEALETAGTRSSAVMDSWYIEKDDLRDPAYEKMLFPIE